MSIDNHHIEFYLPRGLIPDPSTCVPVGSLAWSPVGLPAANTEGMHVQLLLDHMKEKERERHLLTTSVSDTSVSLVRNHNIPCAHMCACQCTSRSCLYCNSEHMYMYTLKFW